MAEENRILKKYKKMDLLISNGDIDGLNDIVNDTMENVSDKKEMNAVLTYTSIYKREIKNWNNLYNKINIGK